MHKLITASTAFVILVFLTSVLPNYSQEIRLNVYPAKQPFVNIANVIPDTVIDIRYASTNNFMGTILDGYKKAYCRVLPKTASALQKVSFDLKKAGYLLKFFDCYRPLKAVKHMIRWAEIHHPDWLGLYISRNVHLTSKYGHSSGNSVDLTLVHLRTRTPVDMGTDFDDFRKTAWTKNAAGKILMNRMILYHAMQKHGFKNFYSEWWHYTFHGEPAPPQDIDIE